MQKWNITRTDINKFFNLKNGQWMKILFSCKSKFNSKTNLWFMTIVVANTKRKCNDCVRRPELSPKAFYGKNTGKKNGVEPFTIALKELIEFEKKVNNCEIRIVGANDRLKKIYKRLLRYGYKIKKYKDGEIIYKNL